MFAKGVRSLSETPHRLYVTASANRLQKLLVRVAPIGSEVFKNLVHAGTLPQAYNARVTPYRSVSSASRSSAGRASPGALLGRRTVAMLAPASSIR